MHFANCSRCTRRARERGTPGESYKPSTSRSNILANLCLIKINQTLSLLCGCALATFNDNSRTFPYPFIRRARKRESSVIYRRISFLPSYSACVYVYTALLGRERKRVLLFTRRFFGPRAAESSLSYIHFDLISRPQCVWRENNVADVNQSSVWNRLAGSLCNLVYALFLATKKRHSDVILYVHIERK